MIKTVLHKISALGLAMLVLLSTFSFTIEKHFCGDFLIDTAVFSKVERCGGESSETYVKKPCCKDVIDVVEGQDELQTVSLDDLEIHQQLVLQAYIVSYVNLFEGLPQYYIPHKAYSPPNLVLDIQVLDEVYLI